MPGILRHAPCKIARQLLIDMGLGVAHSSSPGVDWPVFAPNEPDGNTVAENAITIMDGDEILFERIQIDGQWEGMEAFRIMVRSGSFDDGYEKSKAIAIALDEDQLNDNVIIDGTQYRVDSTNRQGGVLSLGRNLSTDQRYRFSIDAAFTVYQV